MPMYRYNCSKCRMEEDRSLPLARYAETQFCSHCGGGMLKVLQAPAVVGDYAGYRCPVTGRWIEGRKAHRENLREQGCRVLEPGEVREAQRRADAADEALAATLADAAASEVSGWSPAKQERLAAELSAGAEATFTRTTR